MKKKVVINNEKKSRKGLYWALFLSFLMLSSVFGMWRGDDGSVVKYNDHKYVQTPSGWKVYKDNLEINLMYNPNELKDVEGISFDLSKYNKVYVVDTFPEVSQIVYELDNLYGGILKNPVPACSEDVEGCEELPLKTCEDASENTGVILFDLNNEESYIEYENNCLIISGSDTEKLIKVLDKSALVSYGLI